MGYFLAIAPYFTLIVGVLTMSLFAFVLTRTSSKDWENWYHNASLLQFLGFILFLVGSIIAALVQITHTAMEPISAMLDFVSVLFTFSGCFFIFRAYWIRPKKEGK